MKVVLITGIYFPDIGGPATYIPSLAQALINRGYEVSVISLTDQLDTKRPHEPWKRIFVSRKINKISRTWRVFRKIRIEAKNSCFVFSNGMFPETAIATLGLNCKTTAKIVGDPVWERVKNKKGTQYSIDEFSQKFNGFSSYIQRKIINLALNQFDILTVPSENLAKNIRDWGIKKKVSVIPNGVKCIEVDNTLKDFDVISLARLVNWKRVNLLIEACAIANLRLAIVGDGPERDNLELLAQSKGCDATFFGHLDHSDSIELLKRSSIFALLSSYEGLSFALVEAMMLEKKILVSNAPGNIGVIHDGIDGVVTSSILPREIAIKLQLMNREDLGLNEMRIQARKKARRYFCEDNQVGAMIDLLTVST